MLYQNNELSAPVMESIRTARGFARTVAAAILVFFLNAIVWPSWAIAIESERQQSAARMAERDADNRQLGRVLKNLRDEVHARKSVIDSRLSDEGSVVNDVLTWFGLSQLAREDISEITWLGSRIETLHQQALQEFDQTDARLKQRNLPAKALERQAQAKEKYRQAHARMQAKLAALFEADSLAAQQQASAELDHWLNGLTLQKPRDPFDPHNLSWGTPDPALTPQPAASADELSLRTGLPLFEQGEQLASNVITADMLDNPGGPVQADLDPTIDIQLSDAIRAKAAELNHEPLAIYHWVRNHIEFIPSYGSIQGADYTLQHGKGNAFDTASLLIALLRASNIPARYAFGTVQIPADKVMNWVGNVATPEAAGNLLGQGGIPHIGLLSGGQISHFKLEHVWVEAWVDYFPSGGARHITGDNWIAMDASFKQYHYSEGMALEQQVPFDAQSLADSIEQSSTINETEGWVQNVPQAEIEAALNNYRTELESFLQNQAPDATVGDVLGSQQIKTVIHEHLPAGLPYQQVTRTLVASTLPDNLRWKFRYQLHTLDFGAPGTALLSIEQPTATLAGQKLALSFRPATTEDEETLASYLPEPDENSEIHPEDIPDTLPGYLISLLGEFSIGNDTATTASMETVMGTELHSEMGYWQPGRGWQTSRNYPIAGEYRAIALDLQGISQQQAQALQAELEATQQKLTNEDFTDLTKQQLVGDLLYSTILGYFALNNVQDQIAQTQANSVGYRTPSYGLFKTSLTPEYWYGIPRNVKADGLGMDVDRFINQRVDKGNNQDNWLAFNRAQGARMSAMEHLVPEQMFSTEDAHANGISAVKAIQLAAAQGQKIYTITQANASIAMQQLQLSSEIKADIRNAVSAGMEVTTHQQPVNFFGSPSVGYILLDPNTGAGAYRIGGGENGGKLKAGVKARLLFAAGVSDSYGGKLLKRFAILNMILGVVDFIYSVSDTLERCKAHPAIKLLVTIFMITLFAGLTYALMVGTAGLSGAILPILIGEMVGYFQSQMNEMMRGYACD
jgi:hypothetical protein